MARGEGNRPWYPWYPGDWKRDTALQACSFCARALWREMLDLMHDGEPYGHLTAGGVPITPDQLARIAGESLRHVQVWLAELESRRVFSRTEAGVIFSRRMVRDERNRKTRGDGGRESTTPETRKGAPGRLFNILFQQFHGCLACAATVNLELHRVTPGRHGGKYEAGNVLLLCRACHDAMEANNLTVETVLARVRCASLLTLFEGYEKGIEYLPLPTPSSTPNGIPPQRQRQSAEGERVAPAADDGAPEAIYEHFRQRAGKLRGATVPVNPNTFEQKAAMDFCATYGDEAQRLDLVERYLRSEHRDLRAKPPTMGQVVKWASWLESQPATADGPPRCARCGRLKRECRGGESCAAWAAAMAEAS